MAQDTLSLSAAALIIGPGDKVPLVKDPKKPLPHYWKLPGGKGELGETPEETALREAFGEVGLRVQNLKPLLMENRTNHKFYLFAGNVESFDDLLKVGDEGEDVKLFDLAELESMPDFFPPHLAMLRKAARAQAY